MRNPDKNRFIDAVRHVEVAELPFVEPGPDMTLINKILGRQFPLSMYAYDLPIADHIELCLRMGVDMMQFARIWRLGRKQKVDHEGRIHYIDGTMKTPASLKDIWFPDLDIRRRRLEETLAAVDKTGLGLICDHPPATTVVNIAVGMQDYWINTIENPRFIHEFQKIINEFSVRALEMLADYNVEAINIGLLVGMKSGPMCSVEMLEEFQYPILREHMGIAKEKGMLVRMHVDGNVNSMIQDFIDMGTDCLNPLEPCDGAQDIYEIKRLYGDKIALHGNIDVAGVLANGTPQDVRQDTIEHMERLGTGGGYVVGSSHDLHAQIPLENFYAMRDAVHDFRFVHK